MKQILLITNFIFLISLTARAQRPLESQARFDGFYTLSLDKMLDTLAVKCHARIIYDKAVVEDYSIVDHFFNESLKEVLGGLCDKYGFHYWVEPDETIYIIRSPQDLAHLKKIAKLAKAAKVAEEAKAGEPKADMTPVERYLSQDNAVNTVKQPIVPKTTTAPVEMKGKPFNLSGRVIDASNGESLPSAVVRVQHTGITAVTNADGYFTLMGVPADTCMLDVTYIGYQQDNFRLSRENVKEKIVIGLFSSINSLNEVVISDKKSQGVMSTDKRRVSVLQISPAKLDELPNIGEKDILRSFQLMPGISGSNESSSGAYVRGGTPDQNLVLFDGFTVYQVDHLYGFFSAFNSNAVKDVTLYKGGFSAKYGGRLSSVTDIVGKEGNSKEENIGGDLSLLSANIYFEKPINDHSTLLLAFRRSYQGPLYNKIFNSFNSSTSSSTASTGAPGGGPPRAGGGGFGGSGPTVTTPASSFFAPVCFLPIPY
jgi:ferric enterobactin receptor